MKHLFLFVLVISFLSCKKNNPTLPDRSFYGARLEPVNHVIHGAGQSEGAFKEYNQVMEDSEKPLMYMAYTGMNYAKIRKWFLKVSNLYSKDSLYRIPQVGLSMTSDGQPEKHYEHLVAQGNYDSIIDSLCLGLKEIDMPIYIRIGYEFNGHWNGYEPETYKQAFIRITKAIREHNLEKVAIVWCFSPDGKNKNFMDYYPGDEYVDWWSVDLFSEWHLKSEHTFNFIDSADAHSKPVMIGESTPRYVGVHQGDSSVIKWYEPYFNIIKDYKNIKAFCYINWNWAGYEAWAKWGDARIQENDTVLSFYRDQMSNPLFLHAVNKDRAMELLNVEP